MCLNQKPLFEESLDTQNQRSKVESAAPEQKKFLEFGTTEELPRKDPASISPNLLRSFVNIVHHADEDSPVGVSILGKYINRYGEFDNSKPMADGVEVKKLPAIRTMAGSIYAGEWDSKGRRHGRGTEEFPDGSTYVGYFSKDKQSWKGRLVKTDGTFYQGHFAEGLPHGFGFYLDPSAVSYTHLTLPTNREV